MSGCLDVWMSVWMYAGGGGGYEMIDDRQTDRPMQMQMQAGDDLT
jgi:hypothetical protein